MIVMGIDPGTRVTGWGFVELGERDVVMIEYGAVRTRSKRIPGRLREIFLGLTEIIERMKPDCIAVEETFYGPNPQSTIRMGEGRAVALLAGAMADIPVEEYSATVVKKSVVGAGRAHKSQVQQMVKLLLKLDEVPTPEDAADALAIALCHCRRVRNPIGGQMTGRKRGK